MSYDIIRTRVFPAVRDVLAGKKYNVVIDESDQRRSAEYIQLTLDSINTLSTSSGQATKRVRMFVDFYTNKAKTITDSIRHELDVIHDILDQTPVKRTDAGLHAYFDGEVSDVDMEPGEEGWVFRLIYEVTHTKVY